MSQVLHTDSVQLLKTVVVEDNRSPLQIPGLSVNTLAGGEKTTQSGFSLADLLSRNSASFIKQYSAGTLASPALRGTGSAHTALVWNGFNLQSGMNGQLDLNLIPAFLFDHFSVQQGANSASWGSGAIGGTIFLENAPEGKLIRIQHNSGSWESRKSAFAAGWSKKRLSVSIKGYRQTALNNFQFHNGALHGKPLQRQVNSRSDGSGLLGDIRYRTGTRSYLQLSAWWQDGSRQIPPILTIPLAVARQIDENLRVSGSWNWNPGKWLVRLRSGMFYESIHFVDSLSQIDANNKARTYIQEAEATYAISSHHRIQAGVNLTQNSALSASYNNTHWNQRNRQAGFISWRSVFFKERLNVLLALRQEWILKTKVPFIPSVSASFRLNPAWSIRGQWAKTFRVPTLNDLYWVPGGNAHLKPEYGIASEVGADWKKQLNAAWFIESKLGIFSNQVKNWILWTPGLAYWTPENIQHVNSLGWEQQLAISWKHQHFRVAVQSAFQQVRSRPSGTDASKRLQLIYVPELGWNQQVHFSYKKTGLSLAGTYTGMRFTATDNSVSLPGFYVLNATLEQHFSLTELDVSAFFQVNNLLNADYQVLQQRPMPLVNLMAGLSFLIKSNNH